MSVMKTQLIKSKTPKVYKNKNLNNANFGNYNLNDYQVFLHLISKVGGVDSIGKYLQPENLQRNYTITAQEFSKSFRVNINTVYRILRVASKKLARTAITVTDNDNPHLIKEIPICSIATYNTNSGNLSIIFNDFIMPYLAQVKQKFVLYNLKEISNFGSLYTTRLYELLQEFKDTGFVIKSISQLRDFFAVNNKFSYYNDFKKRVFGHAVAEINSQYEMDLTFVELKEGRKVVAIRFEFKKTYIRKAVDLVTGNERNIYIKPKQKKPNLEKKEVKKEQA